MEEIKEIWQIAKLEEKGMDRPYNPDELIPVIIRLERSQLKLIQLKTIASLVTLSALVVLYLNRYTLSTVSLAGLTIFLASVVFVLLLLNRWRFRITNEERSLPTMDLVDITEAKILRERKIFTTYLPLFALVALTGFNLIYLEYFSALETATRILYHTVITGSIAIAFVLGLSVRIKRFMNQFRPILDRIRRFRQERAAD